MPPAASHGLSTHAQIAIGIIIPMLALVGCIGFFIWYTERQRRRRMTDSSLPPARFARISSFLHSDTDKVIEMSRNYSVNDGEARPARTTSLASKAYLPKGLHELPEPKKLGELDAHKFTAEVSSTSVEYPPGTTDKLDGVEAASAMMRQSYELDASNQTDEPKMCEKRMSYQRRASIPFRSSLRSNMFASRKPSSRYSKKSPPSISSETAKDRASIDPSSPRYSANIEFLKDGTNYNKEVVVTTTTTTTIATRSDGSFEDASRGQYSPDGPNTDDRNSTLSPIPGFYQDTTSQRFSYQNTNSQRFSEASVAIVEIAELSDGNSRYHPEPDRTNSPIDERFSDSPPSWMKRLSNDKSQRSSIGADEKLNEATSAVGPLGGDGSDDNWNRDADPIPSSPTTNNTNQNNTALLISAASSAQRQRSRSRPRRKPMEVEPEQAVPEYDDAEARQAEQDAFDIVEAVSPTRTGFRV